MPRSKAAKPAPAPKTPAQVAADARDALAWLKRNSSEKVRAGMARYGLPSDNALGVSVGTIQKLAKQLGRSQPLAEALWDTGVYEARLLASFVGEPDKVTPALMDRWCREFDNWGVVDTVCFKLFDQCPHAWDKVAPWAKRKDEFQKRAGVVMIACLAGHDENATEAQFLACLPIIEAAAADERNFVKKGVSWALRMVGRRSLALNKAACELAARLQSSSEPAPRWIGRDAFRELTSPAVRKRVALKG